jgi:hypothetical protein
MTDKSEVFNQLPFVGVRFRGIVSFANIKVEYELVLLVSWMVRRHNQEKYKESGCKGLEPYIANLLLQEERPAHHS